MKHVLNFYAHPTPDGHELKWVGNAKKGSHYEIKVSYDEINFETLDEIQGELEDAKLYEYINSTEERQAFYQVVYWEKEEDIQVSPVVKVTGVKKNRLVARITQVIVAIVLLMASVGIFRMLTGMNKPKDVVAYKASLNAAKVTDVKYSNFSTKIEALGQVISTQPIDIVSEVSGRIIKGDVVLRKARNFQKDALLFRVDKEEAILNLKSQRSNFLNALVVMLPDLKLDFGDDFDKWNNYFLSIDINQSLPVLPTINSEREKTFIATKNILGQYYSIKSAEERLNKYEVRAPYSGTITDVYTDAGSVANPGTRVVRVMRTDQLELELPIRKEDIQWIRVGSTVKLFSEDKRKTASGRVVRISNTLDPSTQSVSVFVNINPQGMKLYEGMYLSAELAGRTVTNAMEIDRKSVFDQNKVFVMLTDSTLQEKTIKIHKINTETLLFSGLEEGEKIVDDNLLGLTDGVKIQPLQ